MSKRIFDSTVRSGVRQLASDPLQWLSTGYNGGQQTASAAYNITVPTDWTETELDEYIDTRLSAAAFETPGPVLLTGVEQQHARFAVLDPVEVLVTAGVSNPTTLPPGNNAESVHEPDTEFQPGTINIIVGTTRALPAGALANLVSVVTEAKTATLLRLTGFTGTTSDAVIVGTDPTGEPAPFSGAATSVGRATRACVRDGLSAALAARYETDAIPKSVADAKYGCETTVTATVLKR